MKQLVTITCMLFGFVAVSAQGFVPYRDKDKWGYATYDGAIVMQPQFDSVSEYDRSTNCLLTYAGGKVGLLFPASEQTFHIIQPQYDSVIIHWDYVEAYAGGLLTVYNTLAQVLFPPAKAFIYMVKVAYPPQYKNDLKTKRRLEQQADNRYDTNKQYVRYGEWLLNYNGTYYRQENEYVIPVQLDDNMQADRLNKEPETTTHYAETTRQDILWNNKILVRPSSWRQQFVDSSGAYEAFDKWYYPAVWDTHYVPYTPSRKAVVKKIRWLNPPCGIYKERGKIGLLAAVNDYRGYSFSIITPPDYDSLLYIQGDNVNGAYAFYLKKQDSVAIATTLSLVVKPLKEDVSNLFYVGYDAYLRRCDSGVKLYLLDSCFQPNLQHYDFDLISPREGTIFIHNDSVFQEYSMLSSHNTKGMISKIECYKSFEVANATLMDFQTLQWKGTSAISTYNPLLILRQHDRKVLFYNKDATTYHWKCFFTADRLIRQWEDIFKIEKDGKIGYINRDGRLYFTE